MLPPSVQLILKILSASSAVHHEDLCSLSVLSIVQDVIVGQTLASFRKFVDPLEKLSYQRTHWFRNVYQNFCLIMQQVY